MRTTINISFPNELYLLIRERVAAGAYASTSEYIRTLVREDFARNGGRDRRRPKPPTVRPANEFMAEDLTGYDRP